MGAETKMKSLVLGVVDAGITQLHALWEELGLDIASKMERNDTVQNYFQEILDTMVEEEYAAKEKILRSLQVNTKKAVKLSKELGVKFSEPDSSLVLIRYEQALRHEVDRLVAVKEECINEFVGLERREAELCGQLGEPLSDTRYTGVPTLSQVQTLSERIATLEMQKLERFKQFIKLKRSILAMYDELEVEPGTSLEQNVVCEDEEKFILSAENMDSVANILSQLENRKIHNLRTVQDAIEKINSLYELLQLDFGDKCNFLAEIGGCKSSVIIKLNTEIKRLDMLRKEKIGEIVINKRNELHELWDQCFYSPDQRNRFTPLHCIEFTEELLELHEEEAEKMKEFLQENKDLFGKVRQWQGMWDKVMELERKAKDGSRLMAGGNTLLREEQQRNRVNKMLPKLELELCKRIGEWEEAHGKAFLIDGVCFAKYVQEQREKHALRLELEKQARNAAKSKTRTRETLSGTRLGATGRGKTATVNSVSHSKRAEPGYKRKLCLEDPPRRDPLACRSPRRDPLACRSPRRDPLACRSPRRDPLACRSPRRDPLACRSPRRDPLACRSPRRGVSVQAGSPRTAAKRTPAGGKVKGLKTRTAENSNLTSSTVTSTAYSNDTRSTVNRTRTNTASVVAKIKATARDRRISSESSASNGSRGFRRG